MNDDKMIEKLLKKFDKRLDEDIEEEMLNSNDCELNGKQEEEQHNDEPEPRIATLYRAFVSGFMVSSTRFNGELNVNRAWKKNEIQHNKTLNELWSRFLKEGL